MSNRSFNEKQEKDEKDRQKHEEKTVEEKWRRDPLGAVIWGAILIWAGLVFLAENMGMLGSLPVFPLFPGLTAMRLGAWNIVFAGAGIIILIGVAIRLMVPAYREPIGGSLVLAAILIGIGLGDLFGWEVIWPLIIIAIGLGILLRSLFRQR
jgi:hypothetical protein